MGFLRTEDIQRINDVELKKIEVEEWGGSVFLGSMTLTERFKYDESFRNEDGTLKEPDNAEYMLEMLRLTLKDEHGDSLFTRDNIKGLSDKKAKTIVKLFKTCSSHHFIGESDLEDIKKKLEATPSESLSTD